MNDAPRVRVVFYQEISGEAPVLEWLDKIERNHAGSSTKLRSRIERLAEEGHELRRPTADYLRDRIYELRANYNHQAYRLLYFFHQEKAVLCLGCIENEDHAREFDRAINQAVEKRNCYVQDPNQYTYLE